MTQQWFGVYLGKVYQTRSADPWARLQVPQVLGTTPTNWARPAGFESGAAPSVGTIVLVMFVGGDINRPCYLLTSQEIG